jgi:hypothetical protein
MRLIAALSQLHREQWCPRLPPGEALSNHVGPGLAVAVGFRLFLTVVEERMVVRQLILVGR